MSTSATLRKGRHESLAELMTSAKDVAVLNIRIKLIT